MEESVRYHTQSDQETVRLGEALGSLLEDGDVIALIGELGSGKTWFTKGIALGLGISRERVVTSPSFALMNEYEGRHRLFHMDLYRLENIADFLSAGLDEYFYGDGVVVMEWAERWPEILPAHRVKVELTITGERSRRISLSGTQPRAAEILKQLSEKVHRNDSR